MAVFGGQLTEVRHDALDDGCCALVGRHRFEIEGGRGPRSDRVHHVVMSADAAPKRRVDDVDVRSVAEALDDGDRDTRWWYDPATGQVELGVAEWMTDEFGDDDDPAERGLVPIESAGSRAAYQDMVAFAMAVGDRRIADLLQRALEGRGAFRRFRDTLHEFVELDEPWRTYAQARAETRAIDWLAEEGHVDLAGAEAATAKREATAANALASLAQAGVCIEAGAVVERWRDVERALDAGHGVTLTRDGEPWATISPA